MKKLTVLFILMTVFGTTFAQTNLNSLGKAERNKIMEDYCLQVFKTKDVASIMQASTPKDGTGKKFLAIQIADSTMRMVPYQTSNNVLVYKYRGGEYSWIDPIAGVLLVDDTTTTAVLAERNGLISGTDPGLSKKDIKDRTKILKAQAKFIKDSMQLVKDLQETYASLNPQGIPVGAQTNGAQVIQQDGVLAGTQVSGQDVIFVDAQTGEVINQSQGGNQQQNLQPVKQKRPRRIQAPVEGNYKVVTSRYGGDPNIGPMASGY